MKVSAGNLKKGDFIYYQNEVWQVQRADFYSPGKGSALMKTRIKSLLTAKNIEYTYKSNETVETLDVEAIEMQYLYKDNENLYFMNEKNYAQYQLSISIVGKLANFIKEGQKYFVYIHDEQALTMRPPQSVKFKVIETEDAIKGDTVSGARKSAKVENGVIVNVPLFVKTGDVIVLNPETGEYVERAKE